MAGTGKEGKADGPAKQAEFYFPQGLVVDPAGNVFVAEQGNHRVRKITPAGVVTTVAGSVRGFANGKKDKAQFNFPTAIVAGAKGELYIADQGNHAIRKVDSFGEVSTFAGGSGGGLKNGPRENSLFVAPQGLAIDPSGNIFVADTRNQLIRKIDSSGMVTTFCGHPSGGFDDSGAGVPGTFRAPTQMILDKNGYLYVVDSGNFAIRIVDPQGNVLTLAGSGKSGYKDAQGKQAEFSGISGIALDPKGNVYVADSASYRIRKIDPAGNVTTIAGIGTRFFRDGPFASAAFSALGGLFFSGNKLYIADAGNARIRQMIFP